MVVPRANAYVTRSRHLHSAECERSSRRRARSFPQIDCHRVGILMPFAQRPTSGNLLPSERKHYARQKEKFWLPGQLE